MTVQPGDAARLRQPAANGDSPSLLLPPGSAQRLVSDLEGGRRPRNISEAVARWPGATDDRSGRAADNLCRSGRRRRFAPPAPIARLPRLGATAAVTAMATDLKPNASSNSNHSPNSRNSRPSDLQQIARKAPVRSSSLQCRSPGRRPGLPVVVPIHTCRPSGDRAAKVTGSPTVLSPSSASANDETTAARVVARSAGRGSLSLAVSSRQTPHGKDHTRSSMGMAGSAGTVEPQSG